MCARCLDLFADSSYSHLPFVSAGKKAPGASTQPRARPRAAAAKKEIAEVASSSTSAPGRSRREAAQPKPSSSRLKKEPVEGDDQAVDATTMGAGNGEVQEMVRISQSFSFDHRITYAARTVADGRIAAAPAIFALLSSEGDVFPRDSLLGPLRQSPPRLLLFGSTYLHETDILLRFAFSPGCESSCVPNTTST